MTRKRTKAQWEDPKVEIRSVRFLPEVIERIDQCAERRKWSRAKFVIEAALALLAKDETEAKSAAA